jgi:hypothetical protein
MTIRYNNGRAVEAILLSRTQNAMRVAIKESDDTAELREINGTWVSEDCGPVQVEFAWMRNVERPVVTVENCVCSEELAGRLIQMLFAGDEAPKALASTASAC